MPAGALTDGAPAGTGAGVEPTVDTAVKVRSWSDVPWRTILATVGVVVVTYLLLLVLLAATRIIMWTAIAGFLAIVLAPLVNRVDRRLGGRRALATGVVVLSTLAILVGTLALFIMPVRTQLVDIITDLPGTVHDAANGRGPVGHLVQQLHLDNYVKDNEDTLARAADRLSGSSMQVAERAANALFAFVTILLITSLFLVQSGAIGRTALGLLPYRRRASAQRVAGDAAAAVSGYVIGNLIISLIAGVAAFVCLLALGVPSPVVLALFVAVADLIPLVGATLGAAVCVIAAFLHSPTAGIVTLVFFVLYQQIENGILYPWIMARKVRVNPLVILLSVLLAVELFGIVGALLAVPVSGALQVIVIAVRRERSRQQLVLPDGFDADDLAGRDAEATHSPS
ncbi:MAG TPA: AI-2E family transporter [Ilumatobacteraceae bacterium]